MNTEGRDRRRRATGRNGGPATNPRDAEATRREILDAATWEFADKGIHGARVDLIAARAVTSKNMIYYYFGSKDGLYAAVLKRSYEDFRTAEAADDYDALEPIDSIRALIINSFDAHTLNPHVVRILMSENLDAGRHVQGLDHGVQRRLVVDTIASILNRGVTEGFFRADVDPLQFHMSLSSLAFFYIANRFTFGTVFGLEMGSEESRLKRRDEVVATMMARVLISPVAAMK